MSAESHEGAWAAKAMPDGDRVSAHSEASRLTFVPTLQSSHTFIYSGLFHVP